MTTATDSGKHSALFRGMVVLIGAVVASIAARIMLALGATAPIYGRVIDTVTFGLLAVFFVLFGAYNAKRGRALQVTGGYLGAAIWAIYTLLLALGVV